MENPYEILGIKEGASQEEIKAAYREQVKKYHPDKHQNNPLHELAEEKLQEVNEAYDILTKSRKGGSSRPSTGGGDFTDIRLNIDRGNIDIAERLLMSRPPNCGEWYFLKGMICVHKNWYEEGFKNIQTAIAMEPNNYEYQRMFNQLNKAGGGFKTEAYNRGYGSNRNGMCEMCQCMICTDCCCESMGGDFIDCC